jgi:uncharacterized membrane protein
MTPPANQDAVHSETPPSTFAATFMVSIIVTVVVAAASVWAWQQVPPGRRIPIHWDGAGRANGYGGRGSLFLMPGVMLGITLLFQLLPKIEPRRANLLLSSRAYKAVWLAIVFFCAGIQGVIIGAAFGRTGPMAKWICFGLGALFVIIGNFLSKVRSNFFFGIRTPWTLSSELSWNRTHRLAGWMFVAFGIGEIAATFAQIPGKWLNRSLIGFIAVLLATVLIYSYYVWRNDPDKVWRSPRS